MGVEPGQAGRSGPRERLAPLERDTIRPVLGGWATCTAPYRSRIGFLTFCSR